MTEIEKIRKRYADLLFKTNVPSRHDADMLYSTLAKGEKDGHYMWQDIDYTDNSPSFWKAIDHQTRLKKIILGYGEKKLRDKEYIQKIVGAIRFWSDNNFQNPNWWHNDIGTPKEFGEIGIMLYDVLCKEELELVTKITANGSANVRPLGFVKEDGRIDRWTGANLLWGAANTVNHALLTNDAECLETGAKYAHGEIIIGAHEGIQNDGSFFQHGRLLYSGGYGRSFAGDISTLAYIFGGTQYQFPKEKLEIFLKHILDGVRYMTTCGYLDWQCVGREYVRPGAIGARKLKDAVKLLCKTDDIPRNDELSEYLGEICGNKTADGTKYFEVAHTLCHRSNGIYVGARFITDTLRSTEMCNNENVLGANLDYGTTTCIMKDGDEYFNIAPVWDYSRIPGTTSRTETDEELYKRKDWFTVSKPTDKFGGKQVGNRAVIYQNAKHDGVEAMCADFAFEGGYVRLGCDLKITDGREEALVTTVDQRRVGKDMFETDTAFYVNGICYMTLDGKELHNTLERKHGSWTRNNRCYPDGNDVSEEVLTLEIHHEKGSVSSYAYLICEEDNEPQITVLCNDEDVQAILLPDGTVMAVFHKNASLEFGGKILTRDAGIYIESV